VGSIDGAFLLGLSLLVLRGSETSEVGSVGVVAFGSVVSLVPSSTTGVPSVPVPSIVFSLVPSPMILVAESGST
jgi:hypothetical protein